MYQTIRQDLRRWILVCKGDTVLTRSRITSKLLSETSPETKEKVKRYGAEVMRRKEEIEAIELTEEEMEQAILNAKIHKWSEEKNREYWERLEQQKPKKCTASITQTE